MDISVVSSYSVSLVSIIWSVLNYIPALGVGPLLVEAFETAPDPKSQALCVSLANMSFICENSLVLSMFNFGFSASSYIMTTENLMLFSACTSARELTELMLSASICSIWIESTGTMPCSSWSSVIAVSELFCSPAAGL